MSLPGALLTSLVGRSGCGGPEDVIGEVGGGCSIYPGKAATRVEWWAGLRGGSPPRAAWGGLSEGIQSRWRGTQTEPGRDRCGCEAAGRLGADFGCGCWAGGS